jgi:hypothetical protein
MMIGLNITTYYKSLEEKEKEIEQKKDHPSLLLHGHTCMFLTCNV